MNKKALYRFILWLVSTGILYLITFQMLKPLWPALERVSYAYLSVSVLMGVVFFIFFVSMFMVTPQLFVQIVILGTAVKLLLFGAYCFFMIYSDTPNSEANILFFFVGYVLFTVLEITSLYRHIRMSHK